MKMDRRGRLKHKTCAISRWDNQLSGYYKSSLEEWSKHMEVVGEKSAPLVMHD